MDAVLPGDVIPDWGMLRSAADFYAKSNKQISKAESFASIPLASELMSETAVLVATWGVGTLAEAAQRWRPPRAQWRAPRLVSCPPRCAPPVPSAR